jgi:hypothetical protein
MFRKVLLILIILCSVRFYELIFIPEVVAKAAEWLGIGLIAGLLVIFMVYDREPLMKHHFAFPIVLILFSVVLSMFGAYAFQDQSFTATAYAQRAIYFYLIYFLLHYMRMPGDFIIRLIVTLGLVWMGIYLVQYSLFPKQILSTPIFEERGTIRILLEGTGYFVISYFIWLYFTFRGFKLKFAMFLVLSLAVFVLMGTRQVIASIVLLTILFILQSRVVKSRFFIFMLIGLAFIPVFFLFQDVIYSMLDVTRRQTQNLTSYVRFESARYFLTEFFTNPWAYITGNGAAARSQYALRLIRIAEEHGFYQTDIGLIGEYSKFGILFVIGVIIILYRALMSKLPEGLMFIKYNFLGIILTIVTGAGAFGNSGTNILINSMLLYVIDLYRHDKNAFGDMLKLKKPAE